MTVLPQDLVDEILSRVPAKSLKRFRSACKRWNALFTDQSFIKMHIDKAPKQPLVLILNDMRLSSVSVNFQGTDNNDAPLIEFKEELALKDPQSFSSPGSASSSSATSEQVVISQVSYCDGLLLCHTTSDRIVIWNPSSGETKWITASGQKGKHFSFALGYGNNCNQKLLRYLVNHSAKAFGIYEFSTRSWRILNVTDSYVLPDRGVSLKGKTYWISALRSLLYFDFSTETLGPLLPFDASDSDPFSLHLSVRQDKLSLIRNLRSSCKADIWVIDDTWRKLFTLDVSPYIPEFKSEAAVEDSQPVSVFDALTFPAPSGQLDICQVFHCDGLLLCRTKTTLVVWNPCTGETRRVSASSEVGDFSFALGYENNTGSCCRNYKLLGYLVNHSAKAFGIYKFSTGSWRKLNVTNSYFLPDCGVSLKGNTYWLDKRHSRLQCFDFTRERLGVLCLPFKFNNPRFGFPMGFGSGCGFGTLALSSLRGEQLALIHHQRLTMDIWVAVVENISDTVVLSWRQLFTFSITSPYAFTNFFIDEEMERVVCCYRGRRHDSLIVSVIGDGVYKESVVPSFPQRQLPFIFTYVPSLVPVQQVTMKRLDQAEAKK